MLLLSVSILVLFVYLFIFFFAMVSSTLLLPYVGFSHADWKHKKYYVFHLQ